MIAAAADQPELVALLVQAGANVDARSETGETALSIARAKDHQAVMKLLQQPPRRRADRAHPRRLRLASTDEEAGSCQSACSLAAWCCSRSRCSAPTSPKTQPPEPPAAAPPAPADAMKPADRVEANAQGQLKNPYTDDNAAIGRGRRKLYMRYGCNGCHGGNGGGGICPPLINDVWVYGGTTTRSSGW